LPLDHIYLQYKIDQPAIIKKLFYRGNNKTKMQVKANQYCREHRHTNMYCAYVFHDSMSRISDITRCVTDFKTKEEMVFSVYAEIVSKYWIVGTQVKEREHISCKAYFDYYVKYLSNSSQTLIRYPLPQTNPFRETVIEPSPLIKNIVEELSNEYLHKYANLRPHYKPGSLVHRCVNVLAWNKIIYEKFSHAMLFDGTYPGKTFNRVFFATNRMSLYKEVALLREYDTDTSFVGDKLAALRKLIPEALKMVIYMLNLKPLFGKKKFYYNPKDFTKWFNLSTGGGIAPMVAGTVEKDGLTYKVCSSGKKACLIEATWRCFHRFIIQLKRKMPVEYIDFQVIREKQEFKKKLETTSDAELEKIYETMRQFFIPSMFHQMYYKLIMQPIEDICGMNILIGTKTMHGGYYQIAKFLNHDVPNMTYCGGDIEKMDKNVQRFIIQIFVGVAYMMYDTKNMDAEALDFFNRLFEYYMYHACTKLVLHLGTFWRIERGKVNSGGFDTSLLNSFAKIFLFCLYLAFSMAQHPSVGLILTPLILKRLINMVAYGDDHAWCFPDIVSGVLSVSGYSQFLKAFFNMTLREYFECKELLSKVNWNTGTIIKKNVVLLKRVFVESPYPETAPIIAFKDINQIMISLCIKEHDMVTNTGPLPIELIMSALGQIYDAQSNFVAYDFVKRFVDKVLGNMCIVNPNEAIRQYINDPNNRLKVNKLLRQIGTTDKALLYAFPTKQEVLERSKYDPARSRFGRALRDRDIDFTLEVEYG
jgi:hypothetical protein